MKKFVLFFLLTNFSFSQVKQSILEIKIYKSIDVLVANPSLQALKNLEKQELEFKPKTKQEFLAIVILNCNKAYYQNQLGLINNAISTYENAWRLFQENKLSNYDITDFCLKKLGKLYTLIGDLDNAENTIKQYYYLANIEDNLNNKYAAALNLSNVYQISGRKKEAIQLLEKTIKEEKLSNIQKGNLFNNLGSNYLLLALETNNKNQVFIAKSAFEKAINFLKNEKQEQENLANCYSNLSKIYTLNLDFKNAEINLNKAKEFLMSKNQEPRKLAKFYYDKAELLFQQQNYAEAEKIITTIFSLLLPNFKNSKKELPSINSLYAETVLLDALDLKAQIYCVLNQPKKALKTYQLSFYIEDLFQQLYVYENSKIVNQISNRNRTEKCIEIYYNLYLKELKNDYLENAFQLSEESKSVVLKNNLQNSKVQSREVKIIVEQLQNWNTIIIKEQQKHEMADISKINEAIKKQNELMLLLKQKNIKLDNKTNFNVTITDLYSKLNKNKTILIEYFTGIYKTYIFTICNNKISLKVINNNLKSSKKIETFINLFTNSDAITNDVQAYNAMANELYNLLQIPKKSNFKNLIIIPDGILNFLPFEALITKKSSTSNFSKMHYLVKDFTVVYNNSASFFLNAVVLQNKKETVLGVFPVFEKSNLELSFSQKEMQAIKQNFYGKYLEKSQATFDNFKLNALHYSILHLCTHASSGDIETPATIKFYDQEILYSELYNLNINPNLVVLSACETGLGKLYKAEGAMSISRGFQMAGAQNLLFSLWKVNDFTTSLFMKNFYNNIEKGKSYSEANHNAKLSFLNDITIANSKKSPYYWSAFVYYGSLETTNTTNYFVYIFACIGLIMLFSFAYLYYKKRKLNSKKIKI